MASESVIEQSSKLIRAFLTNGTRASGRSCGRGKFGSESSKNESSRTFHCGSRRRASEWRSPAVTRNSAQVPPDAGPVESSRRTARASIRKR